MGVRAGLVELAADRERRVGAAVLQRDGEQRGGGGLAVRAGDRDHLPALHHRLERGRARQQPQPEPLRLDDLGVVLAHGGRDDQRVGAVHLGGVVADVAARAERAQRVQGAGLLGVAAADRDAAGQHDPGDAGQAGAADADEVHPPEPVGGQQLVGDGDPHRRAPPAGVEHHPGQLLVGVARDQAGGRGATSSPAGPRSVARAGHGGGHPLRRQRGVRRPAARRRRRRPGRALSSCSPLPIGSGTNTAGRPTAATSVTVFAPARQTTRSAAA